MPEVMRPHGVEAGDGVAGDVEDSGVQVGAEAAEGETAGVAAQVVRAEGSADGLDPLGLLVEEGVLGLFGVVVVEVDGGLEGVLRQAHFVLQLGDRLGDPGWRDAQEGHRGLGLEGLFQGDFVDYQVGLVALFQQDGLAHAAGVGVLGDEALAAAVDQDAARHQLGVDHQGYLGGVHVGQVRAQGLGYADSDAVVFLHRRGGAAGDLGGEAFHHFVVVGEAAGGQEHAAGGADVDGFAVAGGGYADHAALVVGDEAAQADVVFVADAQFLRLLGEGLHQHVAAALFAELLVLGPGQVAAGAGGISSLKGAAFSPPENMRPWSAGARSRARPRIPP